MEGPHTYMHLSHTCAITTHSHAQTDTIHVPYRSEMLAVAPQSRPPGCPWHWPGH